ncbi:MAG TPA: hypothetical protein VMV92_04770 [Streptosporangiaceae bacterium]|nr:hypothetical protein [Streptosporangiaceae bacterium]
MNISPGTDLGIVADRHLVAVQTFDISRHTTHPVEIVPGTFVALSGIGPDGDSNGSGKTSFQAAVSVLLGDPQWRLETNGGSFARELLFRSDAAGLSAADKATSATHGYIVGVFADPESPLDTAITVWVKISSTAPYLQARCTPGLHVADADGDEERALQADTLWQQLPRDQTISARHLAQKLYGEAPRCLSYLDTSMRPSAPSLLSQEMTKMRPDEIGMALIALSGLSGQLEEENSARNKRIDIQAQYAEAEEKDKKERVSENAQLAAIEARDRARGLLSEAGEKWRLYAAWQYRDALNRERVAAEKVDALALRHKEALGEVSKGQQALARLGDGSGLTIRESQARSARTDADEHMEGLQRRLAMEEARKSERTEQRNTLLPAAEHWDGRTTQATAADLEVANGNHALAKVALQAADDSVSTAATALANARMGRGGAAGLLVERLLAEPGILVAAAFADIIDVDDAARSQWEPMLHALRDAVVVPRAAAERARAALAGMPGAQVIVADSLDLAAPPVSADGIRYPSGLESLVSALQKRFVHRRVPTRADDDALGLSVLGDFLEPMVGRESLIRRAERELAAAEAKRITATSALQSAKANQTLADAWNKAAEAQARLTEIEEELKGLDRTIANVAGEIQPAKDARQSAREAHENALVELRTHESLVERHKQQLKTAEDHELGARGKLDEAIEDRMNIPVEVWSGEFGGTEEDAILLWEASRGGPNAQPQPGSLLRQTGEDLRQAIEAFAAGGGPRDSISAAYEDREFFADQKPGKPVPFERVAGPLRTRLQGFADHDRATRARIQAVQAQREQALATLRDDLGISGDDLTKIQEMVEKTIESTLGLVSKALGPMTKHGAELEIRNVRPEGAEPWRCEVIPRWRRSPSGSLVSYREIANGAQVKVFAIQLVLAAVVADSRTKGRVLILDELGNSLGDVNRRDVLKALSEVAEHRQVTIFGTCQDSVLNDAADFFGELIWFTHATDTDAYNQPARVWGHDSVHGRVRLTAEWLMTGRGHG